MRPARHMRAPREDPLELFHLDTRCETASQSNLPTPHGRASLVGGAHPRRGNAGLRISQQLTVSVQRGCSIRHADDSLGLPEQSIRCACTSTLLRGGSFRFG